MKKLLVLASSDHQLNLSLLEEILQNEWLIVTEMENFSELSNQTDFLLPTNDKLELLCDMKPLSPINFGNLWLALNRRKSQKIPLNFVFALRNSPTAGRVQRLHFYNVNGVDNRALYQNLLKSLNSTTESMRRPWSENLLPYIESDAHDDIVLKTSDFVIVCDGYPKSRFHFLCIPRRRIDSWEFLTLQDIPLLQQMLQISQNFSAQFEAEFQFGFHVIPSMRQLHLHIVSKDFDSPTFETPAQWHAFNSEFLVTIPEVISELESTGTIVMDEKRRDDFWELLFRTVKCSLCDKDDFGSFDSFKSHYIREYRQARK